MSARRYGVTDLQKRAFSYYGTPGLEDNAVGEVRYVIGWMADQMSRLDWDVRIDGRDDWAIRVPKSEDGTIQITTKIDGDEDQTEASRQLLELIDWTDTNVRSITTNLFVAGQGNYIDTGERWRVLSVIEGKRKETLSAAVQDVPFIWAHPADESKPDAPLFGVLNLLDSLDWLTRQATTQSKQRVLMTGIAAIADGFAGPNGESFWTEYNTALSARMADPDDMSPVRLSGPLDLIKDGLNWIVPPFGYDEVIDRRAEAAIQRLAYGLPIPPEILLGMQAQSRATAFQVEENSYRAHLEPPAMLVAQVAQDALRVILDSDDVEVTPNPSKLLARKNSVEDVKWARDNGLVTPEYTREVLAIPEDAAPDPEIDGVPINSSPPAIEPDPANVAAEEGSPITAANDGPDLSTLLADIDAHLSSELAGYTASATDRARQRLGAAARRRESVRDDPTYKDMRNPELAATLGVDGLRAAGVDVIEQIADSVDRTAQWWMERITQAWGQAAELVPGWTGQGDWVTESTDILDVALAEHILSTMSEPFASPLDAGDIRRVVDAAAGGA